MDDKPKIIDFLEAALRATSYCSGLASLEYDDEAETVTAVFYSKTGVKSTKVINIEGDSGIAMIKDIINKL